MQQVEFTPQKLAKLKVAYNKAIKVNKDSFAFENNIYMVSYAKYLIEYLEGLFGLKAKLPK